MIAATIAPFGHMPSLEVPNRLRTGLVRDGLWDERQGEREDLGRKGVAGCGGEKKRDHRCVSDRCKDGVSPCAEPEERWINYLGLEHLARAREAGMDFPGGDTRIVPGNLYFRPSLGKKIDKVYDVNPEGERILCDWAAKERGVEAIFVHGFPRKKRPFYTELDSRITMGFDRLFRELEERKVPRPAAAWRSGR
jgi:hypothetical protein